MGHHGEGRVVVLFILVVEEDKFGPQVGLFCSSQHLTEGREKREGGREGGKGRGRKGKKEGGREGKEEGGREGKEEGGRERREGKKEEEGKEGEKGGGRERREGGRKKRERRRKEGKGKEMREKKRCQSRRPNTRLITSYLRNIDTRPEQLEMLPHLSRLVLGVQNSQLSEHAHVSSLQTQGGLHQGDELIEVTTVLIEVDEVF